MINNNFGKPLLFWDYFVPSAYPVLFWLILVIENKYDLSGNETKWINIGIGKEEAKDRIKKMKW